MFVTQPAIWQSSHFVKICASLREASEVAHALVVAGSRDKAKAEKFIKDSAPDGGWAQQIGAYKNKAQGVGSYEEVYSHSDVDIVYIGVPHPQHFETAKAVLEAGKGVLLEKPATLNSKESEILIKLAKEKKLFFMEAYRFQQILHEEKAIGHIHHVLVDFGMNFYSTKGVDNRVFAPELAGGAQLDIGPYSVLWGILALYEHPENKRQPPSRITASSLPDPRTGVDLFTTIILDFENLKARANLCCNFAVPTSPDACVRVLGTKGELCVTGPVAARPEGLLLRRYKGEHPIASAKDWDEERMDFPLPGVGLGYEADAVAKHVRDGDTVSPRCSPEDTLAVMNIMDEWRKQSGYKYPDGLEKA
ncbi:hypothetical protein EMMF5_001737 [Cystobasidiomycetes sp. EMM_F5]